MTGECDCSCKEKVSSVVCQIVIHLEALKKLTTGFSTHDILTFAVPKGFTLYFKKKDSGASSFTRPTFKIVNILSPGFNTNEIL